MLHSVWEPLFLSLKVSAVATLFVLIVGICAARTMAAKAFSGKSLAETLFMLPLVLPPSVVGFALLVMFGIHSPIGKAIVWIFRQPVAFTWWAAVIASAVVSFPLMYQTAKAGFHSVAETFREAARLDGAGEAVIFLRIELPLSFRPIVTGVLLTYARALGEFGATLMFAGNIPGKTQTLPTAIYVAVESGDQRLAWMLVAAIGAVAFALIFVIQRWMTGTNKD